MMGGQSSKTRGSDTPSLPHQANTNSQLTKDLRSYEDACNGDPELESFERTSHVINNLGTGVEILSLGSFKEVTNCLLEMDQDVVKVILESKEDIWNNRELSGLVKEYFENSVKTMDFCTALESSLKRAQNSKLVIQFAIKQFEEEVEMQDGAVENKFVKTLEGLQKFTTAGDPFTPQFFALFHSVSEQQVSMLKKLKSRKKELDEKMKSTKAWKKVSNVLFVSVFVSVLIISVVAAGVAASPVLIALASAMAVPAGPVGKWCNTLWNRYEKELKDQKELVTSMRVATSFTINDMDSIRVLVNKLQMGIQSLMDNADFAIREEDAVKLVIDEIKKKMAVFMEIIEDLAAHADNCNRHISLARTMILNRILKYTDQ